jgi:hypothetical protein
MNNQKGEATLFCVLILVALSGLLTLCGLELQKNFSLLKKRTELFLCVKETKGELNHFLLRTARLNWVIKNTTRAQMVAVFFPPLWTAVGSAEKIKRVTKGLQLASLGIFEGKLIKLKGQGCSLDPRLFVTPYELGKDFGYTRTLEGAAKLRKKKWTYYFIDRPYGLSLTVDATGAEGFMPKIKYQAEEKMGTLSSLLSSR